MGKKVFITITGTNHYQGDEFLEKGTRVTLIKDPDNKYDHEAIHVEMEGLGKIGYVANSTYTVLGESFSAGRLYDKICDKAVARVRLDQLMRVEEVATDENTLNWIRERKKELRAKLDDINA